MQPNVSRRCGPGNAGNSCAGAQLQEIANLEFSIGGNAEISVGFGWAERAGLLNGLLHSLPVCGGAVKWKFWYSL